MQKQKIHIGMIVFGVLTALIIAFSQLFYFQGATLCKKEVKTEQQEHEDHSENEAFISLPSGSLPSSPAQVELNHASICLLEILFEEKTESYLRQDVTVFAEKFFRTLFRTTISPNAP